MISKFILRLFIRAMEEEIKADNNLSSGLTRVIYVPAYHFNYNVP